MSAPKIVAGVDGSHASERALKWVVGLAAALGAEVVAVHGLGLLAHLGPGDPVPAEGHGDEIRRVFEEEWCAPLRDAGVPWRAVLVSGEAVGALLDVAASEDADIIAVGSRGAGGMEGLLLGSTSHKVAQLSTRPVVIVPETA